MPVTLAQAALNTQDDVDRLVIDEFRKQSAILDTLVFHDAVNPMGGGSTLTYGYGRTTSQRGAAIRAINSEYTPAAAEKDRFSVDLVPLGGSFEIDRVLAQIARAAEVNFQIEQVTKAATARFNDEVVNGTAGGGGWDGLDEALSGSDTEIDAADLPTGGDWTALDGDNAHKALDDIDLFLSLLDGPPTVVLGNRLAIARFRAIARRTNQYVERPVVGLTDGAGAPVVRGFFGNALLIDAGAKAGSNTPIIGESSGAGTDVYAYRVGLDGFHGVSVAGKPLVQTWLPDFSVAGAVKVGEVEMGPVATVLKATKAAAVIRGLKVS